MGRGRSHRDSAKEQFWREQIAAQQGGVLSIRGYCRRHRLRESAFYFWRRELSRRGVVAEAGPAFVPVQMTGEQAAAAEPRDDSLGGCIEVVLGGERCIRVRGPVDRRALADVLSVLVGHADSAAGG